jgi:protein phosphatase
MLVCPHCQFENPDDHKFCQKCGTSLTEKSCPACEAPVALDAEYCPSCGTLTGTIWRAIVVTSPDQPVMQPVATDASVPDEAAVIDAGAYLDAQQRYQLLEPLTLPTAETEVEVKVLDRQPLQPSLPSVLEHQPLDDQPLGETVASSITTLAVPTLAQSYLELQRLHYTALPHLHDAWEQGKHAVVLLQDRSDLPLLMDFWSSEQVLPLQILHWLHEMTELWAVLHPYRCARSLLELDNLRVDEDQLLCLQRLYQELPEKPPELRDLGRLWKTLFQYSQRTLLGSLTQLCYALEAGEITSIDQLRARLEAIVDEFQPNVAKPEANLPAPEASAAASPMAAAPPPVDMSISVSPTRLELGDPAEEAAIEGDDAPTVVLPMKLLSLEDAGRTDIGRQREHNEDYFSIQTEIKRLETPSGRSLQAKGLYILCDGMGGHAGGEVASALAVDTLRQYFESCWQDQLPSEARIREAIYRANQAIFDLNEKNARSGSGRMGTTLVLVLIHNTEAAIAHVGDSRLYRLSRRRGLEQLTTDHEVGQREIQRGVEPTIAYARPDAYQLTQALGPRDETFINPNVEFFELNEDLLLLLCSDGLTDNELLETYWSSHLEPLLHTQVNLEQGVSQLIDLANQHNGHDNITAVAIRARVRPNLEFIKKP